MNRAGRGLEPDAGELAACRRKALDLLARREHFAAELAVKLRRRSFPECHVTEVIGQLSAEGLLDDGRAARAFVAQRLRRGPEGRLLLQSGLVRRGASAETIEAALAGFDPESEEAGAREAARRWRSRHAADPAALARHLDRKGFAAAAIRAVLRAGGDVGNSPEGGD